MRATSIYIILSSLCILAGTAHAQGYGSSQSSNNNGDSSSNSEYSSSGSTTSGYSSSGSTSKPKYSSSGSTSKPNYSSSGSTKHNENKKHHKDHNKFSFSLDVVNPPVVRQGIYVNPPVVQQGVYVHPHYPAEYKGYTWVGMETGYPIPRNAVVGGGQSMPPATLFVCRAHYRGGLHPGKLFNGRCNIGWGGSEIVKNSYTVLTSRVPLRWVPASHGYIPPGAIQGGYQQDGPLYICQADYNGGTHVGKVVGETCNFGWGGREVIVPYYNVLVR